MGKIHEFTGAAAIAPAGDVGIATVSFSGGKFNKLKRTKKQKAKDVVEAAVPESFASGKREINRVKRTEQAAARFRQLSPEQAGRELVARNNPKPYNRRAR